MVREEIRNPSFTSVTIIYKCTCTVQRSSCLDRRVYNARQGSLQQFQTQDYNKQHSLTVVLSTLDQRRSQSLSQVWEPRCPLLLPKSWCAVLHYAVFLGRARHTCGWCDTYIVQREIIYDGTVDGCVVPGMVLSTEEAKCRGSLASVLTGVGKRQGSS